MIPEELERRCIAPFVRRRFPFFPENIRPRVDLVQPERALIARGAADRPSTLPAQYSYIYTHTDGDLQQIIYILANADGEILRVLISK